MRATQGAVALRWPPGDVTIHLVAERTSIASGRRYDRGPSLFPFALLSELQ